MPDAVNTNSLEYKYANPGPGSVAAGSSAVGQKTESDHFGNNPAFSNEPYLRSQQQEGQIDPEQAEPSGATDRVNPGAIENQGDQETGLKGEGLGDANAGPRPGSLANPSH